MEKTMKNLRVQTKANDVDEKGRVTVAVNGIGIEDSQGDISMPGSFDATLRTDIQRMKWLYNHDVTQLLGVPLEGKEQAGNLVMVGQLNMQKQLCRDVYTDYKLMADYGRTLEHSVGVIAVRRDKDDERKVHEWKMLEYSTLSFLGANPRTFLIDLKSATRTQVRDAVEFLQKALRQPEYSDNRLKNIDMELSLLLKSLNGAKIATCPNCGKSHEYAELQPVSYSEKELDAARNLIKWVGTGVMDAGKAANIKPELYKAAVAIFDAVFASGLPLEEKSVDMVAEYVRCPHCLTKIYKANPKPKEDEEDEETEEAEEQEGGEPEDDDKKKKSLFTMLKNINSKF